MVSCLVVLKNIDVKLIFYKYNFELVFVKIYIVMFSIEMIVVGCCL